SNISALMSAAALGARARALPDAAGSWAASMACASSAGSALALAPPFLALALAASDIISAVAAQMRTAIKHLPRNIPVEEGPLPGLPLRLLQSVQILFLAPGTAAPRTSSSIVMVSSWFFWKRIGRHVHDAGHAPPLEIAPQHERITTDVQDEGVKRHREFSEPVRPASSPETMPISGALGNAT